MQPRQFLVDELTRAGLPVGDINVGGGLGVSYEHPNLLPVPDFKSYFETFRRHLRLPAGTCVHFELEGAWSRSAAA